MLRYPSSLKLLPLSLLLYGGMRPGVAKERYNAHTPTHLSSRKQKKLAKVRSIERKALRTCLQGLLPSLLFLFVCEAFTTNTSSPDLTPSYVSRSVILCGWYLLWSVVYSKAPRLLRQKNYLLDPERHHRLAMRIFSTAHALTISITSLAYLLCYNYYHYCHQKHPPATAQEVNAIFLSATIAYASLDSWLIITKRRKKDYLFLAHHLVMHLFTLIGQKKDTITMYYTSRGMISELTTPLLNYLWFLIQEKRKETLAFKRAGAVMLTLYIPFRIINFADGTHYLVKHRTMYGALAPWLLLSVWGMNVYWYYLLWKKR